MRVLVTGGTIIDGTGAPGFEGDVLLEDDRIAELGGTTLTPDVVVEARGLVVAPGFIDVHSHGDFTLPNDPEAGAKILQGVTTEVVGNCGLGMYPANDRVNELYRRITPLVFGESSAMCSRTLSAYRERLESARCSVNAAPLVPHGNIRCHVMGMAERTPTPSEVASMGELVDEAMEQGSFGLSTGLVYPPGAYAKTDELVALAQRAAAHGGIYASHLRNEGGRLLQAVEEALSIGQRAKIPVQISHHKAAGNFNWGKVRKTLAMIDRANAGGQNVHLDVYPYTAGSTVLSAMFVPIWAFEGSLEKMLERLRDPETRARVIRDSKQLLLQFVDLPKWLAWMPKRWLLPVIIHKLGEVVVVSSVKRQHAYEGRSLLSIARERKRSLHDAAIDLLIEEDTAVAAIAHVMCEEDVQTVLRHPRTSIGSDGFPLREGKPHPRTFGTFPRVLERYVREVGLYRLEEAVFRMTGLPARSIGLTGRGTLAVGHAADLVLFDAARVHDRATYQDPKRSPDGIRHVFVGGEWTVRDGAHTGARGGRVLAHR
jgi:N-acyl-D-aspartate/D-glutamate deacylase